MLVTLHLTSARSAWSTRTTRTRSATCAAAGAPGQDVPSNKVLLAAALIGQERYADALQPLLEAIEAEEQDGGNPPRENWLSMLSSVYYETDDYPPCAR
jgi:hypothetical protein